MRHLPTIKSPTAFCRLRSAIATPVVGRQPFSHTRHVVLALLWVCSLHPFSLVAEEPTLDFNRDIRPILAENCFYCHGQDPNKRMADLRLDTAEGAYSSSAIVPRDIDSSTLIERIHSDDPEVQMPPPKSNRQLTESQKETLARWIREGGAYSPHWAFVNHQRPTVPTPQDASWVRNPIDAFVLEKLNDRSLTPSPQADRRTLIKRLYADLIGQPPTIVEVEAFIGDGRSDAYEQLVDRLLQDPRYGQRMALPWLDAARYADSNGFQQEGDTWQWMWRDWVVKALNDDMPFDQFTIWQLAGDLLPDATDQQKIASGFNRNHMQNGEGGAIAEEQRFVTLFDRMDTTATNWLGLTMACAQCHDHKYDPITQRDYYSMMDAFNRLPESGVPNYLSSRIRVGYPYLELPTDENNLRLAQLDAAIEATQAAAQPEIDAAYNGWKLALLQAAESNVESSFKAAGIEDRLLAIAQKDAGQRTPEERDQWEQGLRKHFTEKVQPKLHDSIASLGQITNAQNARRDYWNDQIPRPQVMSDAQPRQTAILDRGEYLKPTTPVSFDTPSFLPPLPPDAPRNRLGFAQWLVSPDHPLTARVQVNRIWQHYFGLGIVKTSEDFGVQSEYPLHGPLLDWLASEFRESGWKVKALHRLILTSSTYRQASSFHSPLQETDLENRLYARASRFRMPSMVLRDWALAASTLLEPRMGGAPVYPYQPDQVWESLAITLERDFTYPASNGDDLYRSSLYTFWRRTVAPTNMFDSANRQTCRVRQGITSTPLHALTTLNDPTWVEAARVLAAHAMSTSIKPQQQIHDAFYRVLCRPPSASELTALETSLEKQRQYFQANPPAAEAFLAVGLAPRSPALDPIAHAAMTHVCLLLLNLDEALSRE
jgi:hypothetical protein